MPHYLNSSPLLIPYQHPDGNRPRAGRRDVAHGDRAGEPRALGRLHVLRLRLDITISQAAYH